MTTTAETPAQTFDPRDRQPWWRRLLTVKTIALLGVALVIGYLCLTPVVYLLYGTFFNSGFFSLDQFAEAYLAPGFGQMVWNSVVFSVGSAALAFTIGTFLAYAMVRTDVPLKGLLFAAAMVPLIVPGILYTIAWVMLGSSRIGWLNQISELIAGVRPFDIFSIGGMIWVEGTHSAPVVFLFMVAAFRSMDPSLEESAMISGASRFTVLRRITLPLTKAAIAGALLIMVVRALESFEVPALLGLPQGIEVFTSQIFSALRRYPSDRGTAGALAIALLAIAIVGVWLVNRIGGRGAATGTVTGKGFRPRPIPLGRWRPVVGAVVAIYFIVIVVLPVLVMLYQSLLPFYQKFSFDLFSQMSFENYTNLFDNRLFLRSVRNSLLLAFGSATLVMALAAVASWLVTRTRIPGRQIVDQVAFLPLVIPGLVLGLAVSFVYLNNPLPIPIYGTLGILLIAYVTRFLPYGMRYSVSSIEQISGELEESAQVSGASWWQTFRRIVLPLMAPGIIAGWTYIFVISVRELSSSILLYSPGNEVVSIVTFELYENGDLTGVSALGVVMVVSLVIIVSIAYRLGARVGLR